MKIKLPVSQKSGIGRVTFKKIPRTATEKDLIDELTSLIQMYGTPEFVDLRWPKGERK